MKLFATLLMLTLAAPLSAHDFWIEPSSYRPAAGVTFTAGLRVGQDFLGDPVPRDSAAIERFVARQGTTETNVGGLEKQDPAGYVQLKTPGLAVIGYRSKTSYVQLASAKFEDYLRQEGLEKIISWRLAHGESAKDGSEIFSRCAKSLVAIGGNGTGTGFDRPLGFRLELLAERNPYVGSGAMPFRLLYENKPLEGALVTAIRGEDGTRLTARSDRQGRVSFTFPAAGPWLVEAVQMVPAPAGSKAEWESLWASITFELPAPGATISARSSR
jgi:uncharacterized GH25 family protein